MPFIQSLRLTDFRSYSALDVLLGPEPVVLYGANGAGKTNLLEALSLLSPGKGLRRARMEDIARRSSDNIAPAWGVVASVSANGTPVKIAVGQVPEHPRRRTIRIDGQASTGAALSKHLTLMWLTPAQDRLFTGPASDRRKFLDRFTLVHAPDHGLNVLRYEKARSERNRLFAEGINDAGWFIALETDMAARGARIAQARSETVCRLVDEIAARPEGAFPKAALSLEGEAEDMCQSGLPLDDVEGSLFESLARNRSRDARAGRTLDGVHRSDLQVTHIEKNMPAQDCSTGEQKALLIGLVLAHARAQAAQQPLLLLDEVAAHLDVDRRAALIEELLALKTQVFMTGTDKSLFEAFSGRAQLFEVSKGGLIKAP
ncbi:MAG: DNA replication/repair protein RecF [Alphaproteobacteria bacterium]